VVLGIWPDVGVLMIAAFLIPTTLLFHPYWTFSEPGPAPDPSRRLLPQRQPAGRDPRPLRLVHRRRTGAIRDYGILLQPPLSLGVGWANPLVRPPTLRHGGIDRRLSLIGCSALARVATAGASARRPRSVGRPSAIRSPARR
jgi:hypothetical protein